MNKIIRIFTIFLLLFLGVSAIFGGGAFIIDPTGSLIQMPVSHLEHSPFRNFLIPGLILFLFNGVSGIFIAVLVIRKYKFYPELIIIQGSVQSIWIIVQLIMIKSVSFLHYIFFTIGILLIISGYKLYLDMKRLKK